MSQSRPRVRVPDSAAAGETFVIRALISHEMESGQRRGRDGSLVPRRIINRFECSFEGEPVFACDVAPAISANPYFEFTARLDRSGTFRFVWIDDDGSVYEDEKAITVG